jgi:hypothetical protein
MPAILRKLPFFDRFTRVAVQGQEYGILPGQIIVWVSLGPKGLHDLDTRAPRFPAVLDSGFTDGFLIHQDHLRRFAGLQLLHLRKLNSFLHPPGRRIPIHAANLWLHPNEPGKRDAIANAKSFFMEIPRGIGICSDADGYPRLPLLGARALLRSELQVFIDYKKCRVSVRTPRRFWLFG